MIHLLFENSEPAAKINLQVVLIGLTNLLGSIILASRPLPWMRYLTFAAITSMSIFALDIRTGVVAVDYLLGSTLGGCVLSTLHSLVLDKPFEQYRYKTDDPKVGPNKLSWFGRVYWACWASASIRGVGWNYEILHIPAPQYVGRRKFILYILRRLLFYSFLADLTGSILQTTPYLQNVSQDFSMRSLPYYQRVLYTACWFFGGVAGINLYYFLVALVFVASGYSSSEDWPNPFGNWADAYSVRNFWGNVWHQFGRRSFSAPGKKLAQVLRIPRASLLAAVMQLFTTFLFSGMMHALGDYKISPNYFGLSFPFFMLQPFAITAEELIKFFLRRSIRAPLSWTERLIGYTWVVWWFTATAPVILDPATRLAFHEVQILPYSPIRFVISIFNPR